MCYYSNISVHDVTAFWATEPGSFIYLFILFFSFLFFFLSVLFFYRLFYILTLFLFSLFLLILPSLHLFLFYFCSVYWRSDTGACTLAVIHPTATHAHTRARTDTLLPAVHQCQKQRVGASTDTPTSHAHAHTRTIFTCTYNNKKI